MLPLMKIKSVNPEVEKSWILGGMLWLIRRACSPIRGVLHHLASMVGFTTSVGNRRFNSLTMKLSNLFVFPDRTHTVARATPPMRTSGFRATCSSAIYRHRKPFPTPDESGNYNKSVVLWSGDLSPVVTHNELRYYKPNYAIPK